MIASTSRTTLTTDTAKVVGLHGLNDAHRSDLERSGLSPETISDAGIYSASSKETALLLGYAPGSGMVIPYRDQDGRQDGYVRIRLDHVTDGRKYAAKPDSGNRLYVPPGMEKKRLKDASLPIWITEGEKKTLKANQEGLCVVGLSGIYNWLEKDAHGRSVPIEDLDLVTWKGRTANICYDADAASNPDVQRAEMQLAQELRLRGATPRVVRLPGPEKGLDDFLVARAVGDLHSIAPINPLAPEHKRVGLGFVSEWPSGVRLGVKKAHASKDGVHGEVTVWKDDTRLHWCKINMASTRSVAELAKALAAKDKAIPWGYYLDEGFFWVQETFRTGSSFEDAVPAAYPGLRFLVFPLIQAEGITVLYADGGTGKGYLAQFVLAALGLQQPIAVFRPERRARVLYLDWETNEKVFNHRLHVVSEGLKQPLSGIVRYRRMGQSFEDDMDLVMSEVQALQATGPDVLVIVDSAAPAMGADPSAPAESIRFMNALNGLGVPVLLIAHISKADAEGNSARPFGSVFNSNIPRDTWEVRASRDDEGGESVKCLTLVNRKRNEGAKSLPLNVKLIYDDDVNGFARSVRLDSAGVADLPSDLLSKQPAKDRIRVSLRAGRKTVEALAEDTGIKVSVLKVRLSEMKKSGQVGTWGDGTWGLEVNTRA
jgi:Domain of unknown function (DUF3854)/AAA domain